MFDIQIKHGKILIDRRGFIFAGDPIEIIYDGFVIRLYTCPACENVDFNFTLDVYQDTDLLVPFILINRSYRIPLFRPFLYKNIYISVEKIREG
jgi:hypothetical protein